MATNLFGRSYQLKVLTNPSDGSQKEIVTYSSSDFEPNALRISFDIVQQPAAIWQAEIAVYNLNVATEEQAITQGCVVQLYGGYQQNTGLLFQGYIYQPLFEKVNGTDYKVTFRCFIGLDILTRNFVKATVSSGSTQAQFLAQMARQARTSFTPNIVQGALTGKQYPRGKVAFGSVGHYYGQIGRDNGLSSWHQDGTVALGSITGDGVTPDFIYAPPIPPGSTASADPGTSYTIIATPQQTTEGVTFRVMLDPRLIFKRNPPLQLKLDMTLISPLPMQFGGQIIAPFEASGIYCVAGVRHVGDTRSNDWFTEVTAVNANAFRKIIAALQGQGGPG